MFGCSSTTLQKSDRRPNEVTQNRNPVELAEESTAKNLTNLEFSPRYELPRNSQMRKTDVKIRKNICQVQLRNDGDQFEFRINLNADIRFRGVDLATEFGFGSSTNQLPLTAQSNYRDGQYTSTFVHDSGAEIRTVITTDPYFRSVKRVVYEVYDHGKLQLSYFCEPEFIGM